MTDQQVFELIKTRYEKQQKTWQEIADELQKKGHTSRRTRRILTPMACRTIYYNFEKKQPLPKGELKAQLEAMRAVITLQANSDTKIKLLQQMLDNLDI